MTPNIMFETCWETVGLGSQNSERELAHLWDKSSGKACHRRCVFDPVHARNIRLVSL